MDGRLRSDKLAKDAGSLAFFFLFLLFCFLFDGLLGLFVAFTVGKAGEGNGRKTSDEQNDDQHFFHIHTV